MMNNTLIFFVTFLLSYQLALSAVPVVYVVFGESIPVYVRINAEMASRYNPVVVLYESKQKYDSSHGVSFINMEPFMGSAKAFSPTFHHMSKDTSQKRALHELWCYMRWFVLQDYMVNNKINRAFFGDGDATVFTNITQAFDLRTNCIATINIEAQGNNFHWVGAGESSLWTVEGIQSFCQYTSLLYKNQNYLKTLQGKFLHGSSVVDMSALWLWYVSNMKSGSTGWESGRPYQAQWCERGVGYSCDLLQKKYDAAFTYASGLTLPPVKPIHICNGLDIVGRTTFDHMHGWNSGTEFSLNIDTTGIPTFTGIAGTSGGKPETLDEAELKTLSTKKITINTLHYQGNSKELITYDVCRILLLTGNKVIKDPEVKNTCDGVKALPHFPSCQNHSGWNDKLVCI